MDRQYHWVRKRSAAVLAQFLKIAISILEADALIQKV
jgi:hypothetical protein